MYKPYKLNPFWESVLLLGIVGITWGLLSTIGVAVWLRWTVLIGQAVTLMILLEVILPRYRYFHAARQLKVDPSRQPRVKTKLEGIAEVIAEGPTFDPFIGRGNHHGDTEPLDQTGIDKKLRRL